MRYRKLGSVGLETSVVGVGASPLGPVFVSADRMTSRRAVAVARRSSPKGTSLKLRTGVEACGMPKLPNEASILHPRYVSAVLCRLAVCLLCASESDDK